MSSVLCFMVYAALCCGSSVQTDWSGGESPGPVSGSWSDVFASAEGVSAVAVPGQICLGSEHSTPVETTVNQDMPLAAMAAADLNGDGRLDLVGASLVEGALWWFENTGDGWVTHSLPGNFSGGQGCSVYDVNRDGNTDVVGCVCDPNSIVLWYGNGDGTFSSPVVVETLFPGAHCAVGCFADSDDLVDFFASGNTCHQVAVFYGDGDDQWTKKVIDPAFNGTQSVASGDFNGDGLADAAAASLTLGEFVWYENPGNRVDDWEKHVIAQDMPGAHHVVSVDMNRDGIPDVLGTSFSNRRITWWENSGGDSPSWELHTIAPGLTGAVTALAGDFDGDNDLDVAGAGWSSDRVNWYENLDGSGEDWKVRTAATGFNGAWPLAIGDFSGNGRLEIAAGADVLNGPGVSHGPSVFDVCSFAAEGWLLSSVLDTEEDPQWASFQFQADVPSGCSISFKWRSSDDPGDLGEWSQEYSSWAELSGLVHRYVQYRVELFSGGAPSPVLSSVELYWDPAGVQEEASSLLFQPVDSPVTSSVRVMILDETTEVSLHDVTGRVVASVGGFAGQQVVSLGRHDPGVYFLRGVQGEVQQVEKVCVTGR